MPKSTVLLAFVWICILVTEKISALSCGECRPEECEVKFCPYGVTKDVCNCCDVCAKGEKEECGGLWGLSGRCAVNLTCTYSQLPDGVNFSLFRTGICLPENPSVDENLTTD